MFLPLLDSRVEGNNSCTNIQELLLLMQKQISGLENSFNERFNRLEHQLVAHLPQASNEPKLKESSPASAVLSAEDDCRLTTIKACPSISIDKPNTSNMDPFVDTFPCEHDGMPDELTGSIESVPPAQPKTPEFVHNQQSSDTLESDMALETAMDTPVDTLADTQMNTPKNTHVCCCDETTHKPGKSIYFISLEECLPSKTQREAAAAETLQTIDNDGQSIPEDTAAMELQPCKEPHDTLATIHGPERRSAISVKEQIENIALVSSSPMPLIDETELQVSYHELEGEATVEDAAVPHEEQTEKITSASSSSMAFVDEMKVQIARYESEEDAAMQVTAIQPKGQIEKTVSVSSSSTFPDYETEIQVASYGFGLLKGESQLSYYNSPSTDLTLPQNRPNKINNRYGPTYQVLISSGFDDSPSTELTLPQNRPNKINICYGSTYQALMIGGPQVEKDEITEDELLQPADLGMSSYSDGLCERFSGHSDHVVLTPLGGTEPHDKGQVLLTKPIIGADASKSETHEVWQDEVVQVESPRPRSDSINARQETTEEASGLIKPTEQSTMSFINDSGSSDGAVNPGSKVSSPPMSTSGTTGFCPESQGEVASGEKESLGDSQELSVSSKQQFAPQLAPKEPLDSITKALATIPNNSKLSPLDMIQESVAAIFSHGTDTASTLFQAIAAASSGHRSSTDGKITVYPGEHVDSGPTAWDSALTAATLPLLFGTKTTTRAGAHLDTRVTAHLGALHFARARTILDETAARPSASLAHAFHAARNAARAHAATTLLSVRLVDTHSLSLLAQNRGASAAADRYTSFTHHVVLGVGPAGGVIWQAWGDGKRGVAPGAYGLDWWIAEGGARRRSWDEMEAWVRSFEKLVSVGGLLWGNQRNKLYKRCFGPDLVRLCFPQGKLAELVPKIRPWVEVEVLGGVRVEDVGKFEFCL